MATALILGATSDIGFAIAKKFASEKYNIQLAGRVCDHLVPLQSDIRIWYGVECSVHTFDARDFSGHTHFYDSLKEKPDVTIYVIGCMNDNENAITDWITALNMIECNYTGAVSILNIVAADYAKKGKGCIVGISSVAGNRGRQSNYIYGSAKAALTAYLSGLRNRMYHHGVHVVTVLPGFVFTKMTEQLKLPKLLTAQPSEVAEGVYNAVVKKKNIVYIKWFWRWIMMIITSIPENIFKKKKL